MAWGLLSTVSRWQAGRGQQKGGSSKEALGDDPFCDEV